MATIALDVDGVICDFVRHWHDCAYAADITLQPIVGKEREWELENRYAISNEDYLSVQNQLRHTSPALMRPIDGALPHVNFLMEDHEVYFVTASFVGNPMWEFGRRAWFRCHLGQDAEERLVFCAKKEIVRADVFVDDKPENIVDWVHKGKNDPRRAILFGALNGERADATEWFTLFDKILTLVA